MKHRLTKNIFERYTDRACNNFYASDRSKSEKKLLKEMRQFLHIQLSTSLISTWGIAYLMDMDDENVWKFPVEVDGYLIEPLDNYFHVVIEYNLRVLQWAKPQDVFDTVAHELAHCLDFCVRGLSHHDKYWRSLTVAMGGSGLTLTDVEVPDYVYEDNIFKQPHLRKGYHDVY